MSWKAYSWKAITCCVSKGVLTLLGVLCLLGALIGTVVLVHNVAESRRAEHALKCDLLRSAYTDSGSNADFEAWRDCIRSRTPEWVRDVLPAVAVSVMALVAFAAATSLVAAVCSSQIAYCQAAVDTGRKPWYWIPWSRIADPLPPREWIETTCEHCDHTSAREETEEEWRARLGLAPLEHAAREDA